jgi:hypothetical protein
MGSVEEGVWGSGFEWGECVKLCGESFFSHFCQVPLFIVGHTYDSGRYKLHCIGSYIFF